MLSAGTQINPFFQNRVQTRTSSQKPTPYRFHRQQSPSTNLSDLTTYKTPTHLQESQDLLRKSPSFRLKNYRHVTPGQKQDDKKYQRQDNRKNRITALEDFYKQLGTDEDISVMKSTQPVKKSNALPTPSSSSQTTSVPKHMIDNTLDERETNIEEVHFHQEMVREHRKKFKTLNLLNTIFPLLQPSCLKIIILFYFIFLIFFKVIQQKKQKMNVLLPPRYSAYLPTRKRPDIRAKSSQAQRYKVSLRCSTQASPDRTPSQSEIRKIEVQANDRAYSQSSQIKSNPTKPQIKRPTYQLNGNDRLSRMSNLQQLMDQLEQEKKPEILKYSLASDFTTVPKTINEEQSMEELHFFQVQSQQRTKQLQQAIEGNLK
ncbi:hypothetical protein pb186bvf_015194 [Paramecium bursaria]